MILNNSILNADESVFAKKRVILRVDINVPLSEDGKADAGSLRMLAAKRAIERLQNAKARVVVIAHRGEPKELDTGLSLQPIVRALIGELNPGSCLWQPFQPLETIRERTLSLVPGDAMFVENIRFFKGETDNEDEFSKNLASLGDIFVNDAFGVCHRKHASVVGVTKYLPSYAGLALTKELEALSRVTVNPVHPFVAIVGGAKIDTKLAALKKLLDDTDKVYVGGALAAVFFAAKKLDVGRNKVDEEDIVLAKSLLKSPALCLPRDVAVMNDNDDMRITAPEKIKADETIVDIGRESISNIASDVRAAKTVVWNGPVGIIEDAKTRVGTDAVAHLLAEVGKGQTFVLAGGGETVDTIEALKLTDFYDHVSVGGGAMLEYIGGAELPGLEALKDA